MLNLIAPLLQQDLELWDQFRVLVHPLLCVCSVWTGVGSRLGLVCSKYHGVGLMGEVKARVELALPGIP